MNHGLTLIVSFFSFVQTSFREFGEVGWARTRREHNWSGSLAKGKCCLGPAGVINCTPLSALSFWVSLFPRTCGYNSGLAGKESAMQETWAQFLCWEDPLVKGKATPSCILAWRISWTVVHGVAKSQTQLSDFCFLSFRWTKTSTLVHIKHNNILRLQGIWESPTS